MRQEGLQRRAVSAGLCQSVRVSGRFARVEYRKRVLDYLKAVRAPFEGINLTDEAALAAAHREAQAIGAPLSRAIKAFCKENGVRAFDRIDAAHENRRFLVALPGEEPLLR